MRKYSKNDKVEIILNKENTRLRDFENAFQRFNRLNENNIYPNGFDYKNDTYDVDISESEEAKEKNFKLVGIEITDKYITSDGKVLTNEDVEMAQKKGEVIELIDPEQEGLGENPTLDDLRNYEEKEKNKMMVTSSGRKYLKSPAQAYKYVTSQLYVYEYVSGKNKRNYFEAKWNFKTSGPGKVDNSVTNSPAALLEKNDIAVLAWAYGPSSRNRSITLRYYRGNSNKYLSGSSVKEHPSADAKSAAYIFSEVHKFNKQSYFLNRITLTAESGSWTPSKFGEDGSVRAQYANGGKSTKVNGFSVSSTRSVSISWSTVKNYAFTNVYTTVPR
ncbi:hypothetical protein [Paracerasibacillus soli]|uniref:Uncharacterized protein n=2 Tax=Paracerasibacillus soli TaxID=480284 RepID=A0ABU5CNQ9_9BACI|nr:hypothetical protein [Virgibacillus soli]MDY0407487.1 hypothetical protein [Virgibacillus soli]